MFSRYQIMKLLFNSLLHTKAKEMQVLKRARLNMSSIHLQVSKSSNGG